MGDAKTYLKLLTVCLMALCTALSPAVAVEEILKFESVIQVNRDGSLQITETIHVRAEGKRIKHGIYRDFPIEYVNFWGFKHRVGFRVTSVTRNEQNEPYTIEDISSGDFGMPGGKRVKIGSPKVRVRRDVHIYSITYQTTRQLRFFDGKAELYWNVTGNGWEFPINLATAKITLPSSVPGESVSGTAYTGPTGSKNQDYEMAIRFGQPFFETTAPLGKNEGLTISVEWPKQFLSNDAEREGIRYRWSDNPGILAALLGLLAVLLYYYYSWSAVGKDPVSGTVIPRYEIPGEMGPAEMRFLDRMGFDSRAFTAELLDMAVKGYLHIEQKKGSFTIQRADETDEILSETQKEIVRTLLGSKQSLKLSQTHHKRIQNAVSTLKKRIERNHLKKHLHMNRKPFGIGVLLSVAVIFLSAALHSMAGLAVTGFMSIWLTMWTFGVVLLVKQSAALWRQFFLGSRLILFAALFMTAFTIPFLLGEVMGIFFLATGTSVAFVIVVILLGIAGYLFFELLKAPTVRGQKLRDEIDGLKMYLGTAEQEDLKRIEMPPLEPTVFEKFLPFAVALGLEQEWSEKFADMVAEAGTSPQTGGRYSPSFYSGSSIGNMGALSSSLGSSFSSAISSASTSPSSSGSGGGGSSGGGSGGGGGGGW